MNNQAVCSQFAMSGWFLQQALKDISHEESLKPTATGKTINWLVGHLADARNGSLALLGGERAWPDAELAVYKRGSESLQPDQALPLEELARRFFKVQEALLRRVAAITPEQAAQKAAFSPTGNPDETVGSLLATLAFHEVYHLGQVGMMRRLVGKPRVI